MSNQPTENAEKQSPPAKHFGDRYWIDVVRGRSRNKANYFTRGLRFGLLSAMSQLVQRPRFPFLSFLMTRSITFRHYSGGAIVLGLALLFASCTSPDEVSEFSKVSVTTLNSAIPVFADFQMSCLREVNSTTPIGEFFPFKQEGDSCDEIRVQMKGAVAATRLLAEYFSAIDSLASFGTTTVSSDAQQLAEQASGAFGAGSDAKTAVGSIASFLTNAALSGYRQKQLEKDLNAVSGKITAVTNALVKIVNEQYLNRLLIDEEKKTGFRFREFKNAARSSEVTLSLDDKWQADLKTFESRRASARSLVAALGAMSDGVSALAQKSHSLTTKEVPGLIAPYTAQLQLLIPQIQKAFLS
jgi:hypothetical protein